MKDNHLNCRKSGSRIKPFLALTMLFIAGCAGDPVRVEFPVSHPANSEAYEAEFISPQNTFRMDFTAMEMKTTSDSMMDSNARQKGSKKPMHHDMGQMKEDQSESQSEKKPAHMESGNQHQEHNQ